MAHEKIYVTRPTMPPLDEFVVYLEKIWENKWLTNNGEFHQQLVLLYFFVVQLTVNMNLESHGVDVPPSGAGPGEELHCGYIHSSLAGM